MGGASGLCWGPCCSLSLAVVGRFTPLDFGDLAFDALILSPVEARASDDDGK